MSKSSTGDDEALFNKYLLHHQLARFELAPSYKNEGKQAACRLWQP